MHVCMNVCCVHPNEQRHFTKICRINIGTVCRSLNVTECGGTAKRHAASIIIIAKYRELVLDSLHSHTVSDKSLIWQLYKWISRKESSISRI